MAETESLETVRARLESTEGILEAVPTPLAVVDAELRLTRANPAFGELFGIELTTALGQPLAALGGPFVNFTLRDGVEIDGLLSSVGRKLLRFHVRPMQAGATLLAVEDVTERRAIETEAANRASTFIAMLAHELRNPLAPILTAVRIMQDTDAHSPAWTEAQRTVERQVGQVAHLIEDLLDVSRVTRGTIALRSESVELHEIVSRAVETVQPLVESMGHDLSVTLPGKRIYLEADATRLQQVVANLLHNSAKFTEPGGKIWLEAKADTKEKRLTLSVRDTGSGIDAETLPRVFEPFVQEDRSLNRAAGGLGIGLTLVKTLVELHGGRVSASSAGKNRGSTFTVTLMYDPAIEVAPADKKEPKPRPAASAGLRVVIVDDNRDAADSMATMLRSWGHAVRVAYNGPAGLDLVRSERPECMLLDIGLPGMNGYEVARALHDEGLMVPLLVAVTGYGQDTDRERSQAAGFHVHLVKPLRPQELADLLARTAQA